MENLNLTNDKIEEIDSKLQRKSTTEYCGPFGVGKTTSLKNFFRIHDKYKTIWFNAFDYDYSSNPKATFVNELIFKILIQSKGKQLSNKFKKVAELTSRLFKGTMQGIFDQKGIKLSEAQDAVWQEVVNEYKIEGNKITELKKILEEAASEIEKDLVVIIDDLDRCRPDFALDIIEISKHIFDVEKVSIIYVYDRDAMDATCEKRYGKRQGERYLQKFIDNTIVHDKFNLISNENWLYSIDAFQQIVGDASARSLKIYMDKFDLIGDAKRRDVFNSHDESLYIVAGILHALNYLNPEYLSYDEDDYKGEVSIIFKHKDDIAKIINNLIKKRDYIDKTNKNGHLNNVGKLLELIDGHALDYQILTMIKKIKKVKNKKEEPPK